MQPMTTCHTQAHAVIGLCQINVGRIINNANTFSEKLIAIAHLPSNSICERGVWDRNSACLFVRPSIRPFVCLSIYVRRCSVSKRMCKSSMFFTNHTLQRNSDDDATLLHFHQTQATHKSPWFSSFFDQHLAVSQSTDQSITTKLCSVICRKKTKDASQQRPEQVFTFNINNVNHPVRFSE